MNHQRDFRPSFLVAALAVAIGTLTAACNNDRKPAETASIPERSPATLFARDVHSFARPAEARVTDVALDLSVDFDAHQLRGTATLTIERAPGATDIVLDTRDLTIESVLSSGGQPLEFELGKADPILGRALTVKLPADARAVVVRYATSPDAGALQWLTPQQTAGGRLPYLFSQGEAILTRTWVPTQDSPGIRQSYAARIAVPSTLRAVMSAEPLTPDGKAAGNERVFEFRMREKIPPYLFALAVGDLSFKSLGKRSGVYAEPGVVDRAAYEFADMEKMIEAAERIEGPYRWGRYDVLVLPPSFPFGGMENPRLTFATPTVLAGDRSLTDLVAHELAHSWSGNLVTNATWSDFWLNEGFTTYFERRIIEAVYGRERALTEAVLGRRELADKIQQLGADSPDTILHIDLSGRDPDEGSTSIPYQKGAAFLETLEQAVGRDRLDPYLRGYFDRNAWHSLTTADFVSDLRANLLHGDTALEQQLRLDEWLYRPGLPSNAPVPHSTELDAAEGEAGRFTQGTPARGLQTTGWTTQQWQQFLQALPAHLSTTQLHDLDATFHLSDRGNSEVLFAWLRIAVKQEYRPAMPALERFLTEQGRRKFVQPLYEDLMRTSRGSAEAKRIYRRARPLYHPLAQQTVDRIVR